MKIITKFAISATLVATSCFAGPMASVDSSDAVADSNLDVVASGLEGPFQFASADSASAADTVVVVDAIGVSRTSADTGTVFGSVPEPSSVVLIGSGLFALSLAVRRRFSRG